MKSMMTVVAVLVSLLLLAPRGVSGGVEVSAGLAEALEAAGANRSELERALEAAPEGQADSMAFLIAHMPAGDLRAMEAERLLGEVALAYEAVERAAWGGEIPEGVFRNGVLPYASVSEARDPWREDFAERFGPLVAGAATSGEAALILNREVFPALGVKYSTERKRADQSPAESIAQGKASCTGLSIILVNACRAVGVPARVVAVPQWWSGRGNHTWVEVWDSADRDWHFVGAAEPDPKGLDRGWFTADAARAEARSEMKSIYAVTWEETGVTLPMVWARGADPVNAVNVTGRYQQEGAQDPGFVRVSVRARLRETGERIGAFVSFQSETEHLNGQPLRLTKDERFDTNDLLTSVVERGGEVAIGAVGAEGKVITAEDEETIVDLVFDLRGYVANRMGSWMVDRALGGGGPGLPTLSPELFAAHGDAIRRAAGASVPVSLIEPRLRADHAARIVATKTHESPYTIKEVGQRPEAGWPLVIAMHGGGGAPQEVNDAQWRHMQVYYRDHPEAGGYLYCALRAPTNEWNGFYTGYVYPLVERLIRQVAVNEGVDLDRVYLIGYSHGGYGAFAIGPKMPDRFAAIHSSAAAPTDGETAAENLRNVRFTCMIGEHDTAYGRIDRCRAFAERVAVLKAAHPGGYPVEVWEKAGFGHGGLPDRDLLPELLRHTRTPMPRDLAWRQTGDVIRHHYWLADGDAAKGRAIDASCHNNVITLESETIDRVTLKLDERLIDLTRPVTIRANGRETVLTPAPSLDDLGASVLERGDPSLACFWSVEVDLTGAGGSERE